MKAVILAGGLGTRMQEATRVIPKPMLDLGGLPILWHIMKHYEHYGTEEFCLALGYRSDIIKDYFCSFARQRSSLRVDLGTGSVSSYNPHPEKWVLDLIDTGDKTQTGGRLAKLKPYMKNETFFLTYGDAVSNIDLDKLLAFHRSHGKIATVSAVRPPSRFGSLSLSETGQVEKFIEKPLSGDGETWINGGFFVFEPGIFDYVEDDPSCVLEAHPLENLAKDSQLMAYHHYGFWQCMDTVRDLSFVNGLWDQGQAPWKIWS